MSKNPVALKVAAPYARALFDFVNDTETLYEVTRDIQNILGLLFKSPDLVEYLQNPVISVSAKKTFIFRVLDLNLDLELETSLFLSTLLIKKRMNLLTTILLSYLELVYKTAHSSAFQIISAKDLSYGQRTRLIKKIKSIAKFDRIMVEFSTDESLIGGFLICNEGKVVDYTVKNKLKILAKQLDTVLEL